MNRSRATRAHIPSLCIVFSLAFLIGCNTTSVRPASSGAPSTTGTTPGTVSYPSTEPGSGTPPAMPAGVPSASGSHSGHAERTSRPASQAGKSDDEILADALEEFGRKNSGAQQGEPAEGIRPPTSRHRAMTHAERAENLNSELEDKLATFDRLMLSERESVIRKDNQDGGGMSAGAPFGDGKAGDAPLEAGMLDNAPPMSREGEGSTATRDASPMPPDIASIEDDDIIARQLREAAMKEQDPELREKLWDEYRKYKREQR